MWKTAFVTLAILASSAFTANSTDAFFGHRHRRSSCGSTYHTPVYTSSYSRARTYAAPTGYSYGSNYWNGIGYRGNAYGYSGYGASNYGRYQSGYGYGNYGRGGYGYGYPYGTGYRGLRSALGYGNGYYYGGFPASRASGIGLYGW